jgi:hypothetical protein
MRRNDENQIYSASPNVCYVVDGNGKHWICPIGVDTDRDLEHQACFAADEMIYDRMFGG